MRAKKNAKTFEKLPQAIEDAVRGLLASAHIPRENIDAAIASAEGRGVVVSREDAAKIERPVPLDDLQVVIRPEAARLLKCDIRTVDWYRRTGKLVPVYLPGSSRIRGFTAASIRCVLMGEAGKAVAK